MQPSDGAASLRRVPQRARAAQFLVAAACIVAASAGPAEAAVSVSIGDSYSSGEGAGAYERDSRSCHRSAQAWPRLLGVPGDRHFACSGATTSDLSTGRDDPGPVSQMTSLERVAPLMLVDTVLVTIGGNDLGFARKVASCRFGLRACLGDRRRLEAELAAVEPVIAETYRRIRISSRAARVVAVGYPDITPDVTERDDCVWLSERERANIDFFAQRLDATLRRAAQQAAVTYVSARDALDDHELCTGRSWVVSVARLGRNWLRDREQGHPNRRGQKAIAAEVRAVLPGQL